MNTTHSNVVSVPARRKRITYKGLSGWIEYKPKEKKWVYDLKLIYPVHLRDEARTEEEITLKLKTKIEETWKGRNKHVQSTD